VIDISNQLDAKIAALRCYRSQLVDNLPAGVHLGIQVWGMIQAG
jgi:hypothetical protein